MARTSSLTMVGTARLALAVNEKCAAQHAGNAFIQ